MLASTSPSHHHPFCLPVFILLARWMSHVAVPDPCISHARLQVPGPNHTRNTNEAEEWFFSHCPRSSKCDDLEVRFPLRLNTSLAVTAIDYSYQLITIDTNLSNEFFSVDGIRISLINCSKEFKFDPQNDSIARPGDCFNGSDRFVYVVGEWVSLDLLPSDCVVIATGGEIGYGLNSYSFRPFQSFVDAYFAGSKTRLQWSYSEMSSRCSLCESNGNHCGLDHASNSTFCFGYGNTHSSLVKLIAGLAAGVLVIVMILGFTFFFISRKAKRRRELRMKVEMFRASYKTTKPARYTYAGIKKITNRFKYKLGEGGFGSVYKGELRNGIPVAVKMLEETKSEGDDFINEVGTFGRIHHINIVRLLGFCSEGTRCALVYEFMPNESLEKYIFSRDANGNRLFGMDKLLGIAIGIARGLSICTKDVISAFSISTSSLTTFCWIMISTRRFLILVSQSYVQQTRAL
ncbi:Glycerophosphodiester phosphodiesterase protein [Dioscorea alata]|uniref:Glycerophosphodiester phosphodiesterase protein n=1 Tax=Dioscorea alata TaxID=55571 RepID=A0ACB7UEB2_DIOAL|nr:Glycerophosphodiester phosphodiesterase protein [Dioscorea alata]